MNALEDFADRYVAVWNEPDADRRRRAVTELWTEDGVQVLQPPEDIRSAAAALGVSATLEARGHAELDRRVARAYEDFVAPGDSVFRRLGGVERLRDVVRFRWEMAPVGGGEASGAGLEIAIVGDDGRIRVDYQFIER